MTWVSAGGTCSRFLALAPVVHRWIWVHTSGFVLSKAEPIMPWVTKILAPIDFSERSLGAVRYARLLACRCRAELSLVHVLSPPPHQLEDIALSELYERRAAGVEQEMNDVLAGELAGISASQVILEGEVAREIVEYAHHQHADLIVMATHGYTGFRPLLLGSNTA